MWNVGKIVERRMRWISLALALPFAINAQAVPSARAAVWTPLVEQGGHIFPLIALATATTEEWDGVPRVLEGVDAGGDLYFGDILGPIGIEIRTTDPIEVEVTVEIPGYVDPSALRVSVPGNTRAALFPRLEYDYERLLSLYQPRSATARFTISVNGELGTTATRPVRLHSVNDVPLAIQARSGDWIDMTRLFAAMVNENHPAIDQVLRDALDQRAVNSFIGYQGTSEDVHAQVAAIWNVLQRRGVRYSSITTPSSEHPTIVTQHVRSVEETLRNRQANCIDGSVLFAAILRKIGIDAFIVLEPSHAFLGYWLDEAHTRYSFLETTLIGTANLADFTDDGSLSAAVLGLLGVGTKNQASYASFVRANSRGVARFNESVLPRIRAGVRGFSIVDIAEQRQNGIEAIAK